MNRRHRRGRAPASRTRAAAAANSPARAHTSATTRIVTRNSTTGPRCRTVSSTLGPVEDPGGQGRGRGEHGRPAASTRPDGCGVRRDQQRESAARGRRRGPARGDPMVTWEDWTRESRRPQTGRAAGRYNAVHRRPDRLDDRAGPGRPRRSWCSVARSATPRSTSRSTSTTCRWSPASSRVGLKPVYPPDAPGRLVRQGRDLHPGRPPVFDLAFATDDERTAGLHQEDTSDRELVDDVRRRGGDPGRRRAATTDARHLDRLDRHRRRPRLHRRARRRHGAGLQLGRPRRAARPGRVAHRRATVRLTVTGRLSSLRRSSVGVDRGLEPLAGAVEPVLADRREQLAALPERERLLERGAAGLQAPDDLDQLLAGGLVRRRGLGLRLLVAIGLLGGSVLVVVAWMRPSATRTLICCLAATPSIEVSDVAVGVLEHGVPALQGRQR